MAKRRHEIEERLGHHPAVLRALLREYDALEPVVDAGEDLVSRRTDEYLAALARLYAAGGRR